MILAKTKHFSRSEEMIWRVLVCSWWGEGSGKVWLRLGVGMPVESEKWEYRFHILETIKLLGKLHALCVQGHHFRLTNFSLAHSWTWLVSCWWETAWIYNEHFWRVTISSQLGSCTTRVLCVCASDVLHRQTNCLVLVQSYRGIYIVQVQGVYKSWEEE